MDSSDSKTIVYVLIVLAVMAILGVSVVKFSNTAGEPTPSPAQRLNALENSPDLKSPQARGFIYNERSRRDDTKSAVDAATGQ